MPHLPVYFILDCSGTMLGDKIASVKRGVMKICESLSRDPRSRDAILVSVIWFNDAAYKTPLTPIAAFHIPDDMRVIGKTRLGDALKTLNAALDQEVAPDDYKPLVFLMTDGQPTDIWQEEATRYKNRSKNVPLITLGLAIGQDADIGVINTIANVVMSINDVTPTALDGYFDWAIDSVSRVERFQARENTIDPYRTILLSPTPPAVKLDQDTTDAIQPQSGSPSSARQ